MRCAHPQCHCLPGGAALALLVSFTSARVLHLAPPEHTTPPPPIAHALASAHISDLAHMRAQPDRHVARSDMLVNANIIDAICKLRTSVVKLQDECERSCAYLLQDVKVVLGKCFELDMLLDQAFRYNS